MPVYYSAFLRAIFASLHVRGAAICVLALAVTVGTSKRKVINVLGTKSERPVFIAQERNL
jgi:hypothetical protein